MPRPGPPISTRAEVLRAAAVLRTGGLVAFPTETVYGLGADAFNPRAVARVFAVKRRPTEHPLIVHAETADALNELAVDVPASAVLLAKSFWPGPLTLVLARNPRLPAAVTGGQDTVAVRVPAHPLALDLLRAFGGAIAAPSANRFGGVSPTTAAHVRDDLGEDVDDVLDGGPCQVGLESTIVDLTGASPRLLRLGAVSEETLGEALGEPLSVGPRDGMRIPGSLPSHYAPAARVVLAAPGELEGALAALPRERIAVLAPEGARVPQGPLVRRVSADPEVYARSLYASLRELDAQGCDVIVVVPPAARGVGRAVIDRLQRAAAPRPDDPGEVGQGSGLKG
jgi:L-threonylcarbamoyladenylate synthase